MRSSRYRRSQPDTSPAIPKSGLLQCGESLCGTNQPLQSWLCSSSSVRGGEGFALARCLPQLDVGTQIEHHAFELNQVQGLRAVADGFFRCGMDFDD